MELNPILYNDGTIDVLQESLDFENSDSEDEEIFYCADEIFASTTENYVVENEVIHWFYILQS